MSSPPTRPWASPTFPILGLFAEALRDAWADAKAIAWKLTPAPLAPRQALAREILSIEAAERPSPSELSRLAALQHRLAARPAAA
jgi:hypothetical protein